MKPSIISLLIIAALAPAAAGQQKFTGVLTDGMCPFADHSRMKMGATDGECAIACVDAHGALFVLYDGKDAYTLSDQQALDKFAGRKVIVTGALDAGKKTIRVASITEAK
jgi:hypothetical protein